MMEYEYMQRYQDKMNELRREYQQAQADRAAIERMLRQAMQHLYSLALKTRRLWQLHATYLQSERHS